MADAAVTITASDAFGLGGLWIPTDTSISTDWTYASMKSADGDFLKFSDTFDEITTVTTNYHFNADVGLGAAIPNLGSVEGGWLITDIAIASTHDDYPVITLTGHNHGENPHIDDRNEYALTADMIAIITGAKQAYDLAGLAGAAVCATGSTLTMSLNHIDANCDEGDHFVGQNIEAMESMSVDYVGEVGAVVIADWTNTNITINDSDGDFDSSTVTADRLLTRV